MTCSLECFEILLLDFHCRRAIRKAERKSTSDKKPVWTKACTTELVRNLFDTFFTDQLDKGNDKANQVSAS